MRYKSLNHYLETVMACPRAVAWAQKKNYGNHIKKAYEECPYGAWLLYFYEELCYQIWGSLPLKERNKKNFPHALLDCSSYAFEVVPPGARKKNADVVRSKISWDDFKKVLRLYHEYYC